MRALFRNRDFRRLWTSQVVLSLGDACMRMGLLEVFLRSHLDQEVETAKMFFALSVPGLLFGPFAMANLDKWERRRVLMISDAVRTVLMGLMVWWLWRAAGNGDAPRVLAWVYFLIFLIGAIATFYLPARYALLPNIVPGDELIKANTLLTTSLAVMAVGGMPLGAQIAVRAGPLWALSLNAVAYALSVAWVFRITVPSHVGRDRLAAMGFSIVLYANASLQAALQASYDVLTALKEEGSLAPVADRLASFERRQRAVTKDFWDAREARYRHDD